MCSLSKAIQESTESEKRAQLVQQQVVLNTKLHTFDSSENEKEDFALLLEASRHPLQDIKKLLEEGNCKLEHQEDFLDLLRRLNKSDDKVCVLEIAKDKAKLVTPNPLADKWGLKAGKINFNPTKKN